MLPFSIRVVYLRITPNNNDGRSEPAVGIVISIRDSGSILSFASHSHRPRKKYDSGEIVVLPVERE